MKLYKYNATTKEYEGEVTAYVDIVQTRKLGEFVYRSLPYTTYIVPPKTNANEIAVFTDDKWEVKPDFRGTVLFNIYTGTMDKVKQIGPIPKNLVSKESKEYKEFLDKTDINAVRNILNTLIGSKFQQELRKVITINGWNFPVYQTLYITSLVDGFIDSVNKEKAKAAQLEQAINLMQEKQINPDKVNILAKELLELEDKISKMISNLPTVDAIVDVTLEQAIEVKSALNNFCKDLETRKNKRLTSIKGKSIEQLMDIKKNIEERGL